jgi:hypothetical protein
MGANPMLLEAKPTEDRRIWLRFVDGLAAEVDFSYLLGRPVFADLADPEYFRRVDIYRGGFGIYWPNEADVSPDRLYELAQAAAGVAV